MEIKMREKELVIHDRRASATNSVSAFVRPFARLLLKHSGRSSLY